ncbi:MAG: hypothetical protein C0408_11090, partial [Odoribacter sp.]|nr:hypothetical protein [Odoribacter sp.]
TIYIGKNLSPKVVEFDKFGKSPGYARNTVFKNNIIYNLGNAVYVWGESKENLWENNCFFGNHPESEPNDPRKVVSDPMFIEPGGALKGINSLSAYNLKSNSPCIDSGTVIENNGGRDMAGNKIYIGKPDIGAFENRTDNYK